MKTPPFNRETAETLISMCQVGLRTTDAMSFTQHVDEVARLLAEIRRYRGTFSSSNEAAVWLIEVLEWRKLAVCAPGQRAAIVAVLDERCRPLFAAAS